MKIAEPFYDKLMPILGYSLTDKISAVIEEHDLYVVEYLNESFDFAICSPRTTFKSDTCLHFGQNKGKFSRIVSALSCMRVLLLHTGQYNHTRPDIKPPHFPVC